MTSYVCLWEDTSGERRWEAVTKEQVNGFMEKLLNDGVRPATVMMAYAPMMGDSSGVTTAAIPTLLAK